MDDQTLPTPRPLRKWAILWLAWIVGIAVWGLYIALIFVLVYRLFAAG